MNELRKFKVKRIHKNEGQSNFGDKSKAWTMYRLEDTTGQSYSCFDDVYNKLCTFNKTMNIKEGMEIQGVVFEKQGKNGKTYLNIKAPDYTIPEEPKKENNSSLEKRIKKLEEKVFGLAYEYEEEKESVGFVPEKEDDDDVPF